MSVDRVLTGLTAFAAGILAGVLLAPRSGEETREYISGEARSRLKKIEGQLEGLEGTIAEVSGHLRESGLHLSERVKNSRLGQVFPEVPEVSEPFNVDSDEVARDLRNMPRK